MKRILILLLMLGISSVPLASQFTHPEERLLFNVDYARFQNDTSEAYLEVYMALYQQLFTLAQKNDRQLGSARIDVKIIDRNTGDTFNEQVTYLPVVESDVGQATGSTVVTQMGYLIPPGEYDLNVTIADSLAPERKDSVRVLLEIEPYKSSTTISDLQLCSNITSSSNTSNPFFKNSLELLPNPNLVFGASGHPVVFSYAEIYNLERGRNYYIVTSILDRTGEVMTEVKKKVQYDFRNAVEVGTMNIISYPSGRYEYLVTVTDSTAVELTSSRKSFFINNPHIVVQHSRTGVYADDLALLSYEELGEEFRQCRYIATDEDRRRFNEIVTAEGRREFLAQFWVELARGRFNNQPIFRAEYLSLVEESNKRFSVLGRAGWSTDRGRVFLLYGRPDEIERYPSSGETKPYEIWQYYQIENGVHFIFVDRSGYGEYVLVHSTKRGEFRDDQWQQYLR
jgi:GWxTD domain-containing protein